MAEIEGAVISLKPGDHVDAYMLVGGQLVKVRVQRDDDVHASTMANLGPPKPSEVKKGTIDIVDLSAGSYGGGQTALVVESAGKTVDVTGILYQAINEDWSAIKQHGLTRTGTSGHLLAMRPADSDMVIAFKSPPDL